VRIPIEIVLAAFAVSISLACKKVEGDAPQKSAGSATASPSGAARTLPPGPPGRVVVTDEVRVPAGLTCNATHLFWFDHEVSGAPRGLMSVAKSGGHPKLLFAGDQQQVNRFVADDTGVYVTDMNGGRVLRVPLDGGAFDVIAEGQDSPNGIAVDATDVYWTTANTNVAFEDAGSGKVTMTSAGRGGAILHRSKKGGKTSVLAAGIDFPVALAVDAKSAYVETAIVKPGVGRVSKKGGPITFFQWEEAGVMAFAVGEARVFWSTGMQDGALKSAAKEGGDVRVVVGHVAVPVSIAPSSDGGVYFVSKERLMYASQDGATKVVADRTGGDVIVDGTDVYYTDALTVFRFPR
jgi:hypothetical protein